MLLAWSPWQCVLVSGRPLAELPRCGCWRARVALCAWPCPGCVEWVSCKYGLSHSVALSRFGCAPGFGAVRAWSIGVRTLYLTVCTWLAVFLGCFNSKRSMGFSHCLISVWDTAVQDIMMACCSACTEGGVAPCTAQSWQLWASHKAHSAHGCYQSCIVDS
jgi:hypothetical protein